MPVVDETNILALIPGDCIGNSARTLPDAATAQDEPREVTIDVAGSFHGKDHVSPVPLQARQDEPMFWTAESAVKV